MYICLCLSIFARVYLWLHFFTYFYTCLHVFNYVYPFFLSLLVLAMFRTVQKCMFTRVYQCLLLFNYVYHSLLVLEYPCLFMFTRIYLFLHFTNVYPLLPMFTFVYLCLLVFNCLQLHIRVYLYNNVYSSMFNYVLMLTPIYLCSHFFLTILPLFTNVYPCLLVFTYVTPVNYVYSCILLLTNVY